MFFRMISSVKNYFLLSFLWHHDSIATSQTLVTLNLLLPLNLVTINLHYNIGGVTGQIDCYWMVQ